MSQIYTTATEYRYLPLTVDPVDGVEVILTIADIQVSVVGPGQTGTWRPIDRLVYTGGVHYAGFLCGPANLALSVGTYKVRGRVIDNPETSIEPLPIRELVAVAPPA